MGLETKIVRKKMKHYGCGDRPFTNYESIHARGVKYEYDRGHTFSHV
jgi:hypothetical protein